MCVRLAQGTQYLRWSGIAPRMARSVPRASGLVLVRKPDNENLCQDRILNGRIARYSGPEHGCGLELFKRPWPLPLEPALDRMKSLRPLVRAAWARCIAQKTRSSSAM